jgi:hypothetical protein
MTYFGDLFYRFDSFHPDFDLFEVLCGKAELVLEEQSGSVLKSISEHNNSI